MSESSGITHLSLSDIKPIYLGYESGKDKYYFYIVKDQSPRFLVYSSYFFLGTCPQGVLSLKQIPSEVEEELLEYLQGKFEYRFKKLRKNSKDATAIKHYYAPVEITQPDPVQSPSVKTSKPRKVRVPLVEENSSPSPSSNSRAVIPEDLGDIARRVSRPRRKAAEAPVAVNVIQEVEVEVNPEVRLQVLPGEAPIKRGRGGPKKVELLILPDEAPIKPGRGRPKKVRLS